MLTWGNSINDMRRIELMASTWRHASDKNRQQAMTQSLLVAALKTCAKNKDLLTGSNLHLDILKRGLLWKNSVFASSVVSMYAKCGALTQAREVLEDLPVRDVVSWNALITGYAQGGYGKEALDYFEYMQREGISSDAVTFTCILKACGCLQALDKGKSIHFEIVRKGLFSQNAILGNALVDMYAKCGAFEKAKEVLDCLPFQDAVSWNALIAGYVQGEQPKEALKCFDQMQCKGLCPNSVTFACILKSCGILQALDKGRGMHSDIVKQGLLTENVILGGALLDMYIKCGALANAKEVLEELCFRSVVSWSALIAGYVQGEHGQEALNCFKQMQEEGLCPNVVTFACVLKACGILGALKEGKKIHDEINRQGFRGNAVLSNSLIDMYVRCGALVKAQEVLEELHTRHVLCWNVVIAGYAKGECGKEVLNFFDQMQHEGLLPDAFSFVYALKACGSVGALNKGERVHMEIVRQGLVGENIEIGNALMDMYVKCSALEEAKDLFDGLLARDVVSWSTLIAGYIQVEDGKEALVCFERMHSEGLSPDAVTFACILKACGSIAALDTGSKVHAELVRQGLLAGNIVLHGALVDMYAKCGALAKATEVLEAPPILNVVSWSSLIVGYAKNKDGKDALGCFKRMQCEGLSPDDISILCVLGACSHSGLLYEGEKCFLKMSREYAIVPNLEHYICMVDLYSWLGFFDKAVAVIKKMCSSAYPVWFALLNACKKLGSVELGRWAFEQAVQLDRKAASPYVYMRNIYAVAGMNDEAEKV